MRSLAAGGRCRGRCAAAAARLVPAAVPPPPPPPATAAAAAAAAGRRATAAAASAAAAPAPSAVAAAARAPRRSSSSSPAPSSAGPPPPSPSSAAAATRGLRRARALLEQRAPPESFSIRGVTFDGRQALIARLQAGEPVALSHEPWNRFDPQAVRICSLRGEHLGYVDRRCTGAFAAREVAYGFVDSVGRVAAERPAAAAEGGGGASGAGPGGGAEAAAAAPLGPWGARVVVWPFLAAPLPEVLPAAMAAEADARLGLRFSWEEEGEEEEEGRAGKRAAAATTPPPARWRRLAAAALARARGVCEATGVTASAAAASAASSKPSPPSAAAASSLYGPLVALPEWRWDEARRVVSLAGAMAVSAPVARCVRAARLDPSRRRAERAAALGLAMDLMRWDVGHMREYLRWQEARAGACEREGWALDLGEEGEEDGTTGA